MAGEKKLLAKAEQHRTPYLPTARAADLAGIRLVIQGYEAELGATSQADSDAGARTVDAGVKELVAAHDAVALAGARCGKATAPPAPPA